MKWSSLGSNRETSSKKSMQLTAGEPTTERLRVALPMLSNERIDCIELSDVQSTMKKTLPDISLEMYNSMDDSPCTLVLEKEIVVTPLLNTHKRSEDADDENELENEQDGNDVESRDRNRKRRTKHKKKESPFEKLNTLKLLFDCGHLTEEEYKERKNQIINEMTGTSSEVGKRRPQTRLQPIMKTVVPHKPPDFTTILDETAERLSFEVDTLEWHSSKTRIKLDLVPFATGQLRNAYFLQLLGGEKEENVEGKLLVSKLSIHPTDPSTYLSDVEMQAVCAHYAKLYNEHNPPLKVHYARSWLLKLEERDGMVCSLEEYIPGVYVKYSNNNGFVGTETSTTEERERNTPQAFSHFTFVASEYKLMVVDIQGVDDHYTDPQIHTADGQGFGAGNLGTYGMEKFLQSHRCNEVCRWLGLKSLNKQFKPGGTAAPNYQMPYRNIKKSSRRITEERNTYSRSSTVSEMLGNTLANSEITRLLPTQDDVHVDRRNSVARCICRCLSCCFTG